MAIKTQTHTSTGLLTTILIVLLLGIGGAGIWWIFFYQDNAASGTAVAQKSTQDENGAILLQAAENVTVVENQNTAIMPPAATEKDADNDGLPDVQEDLYGTSSTNSDTDNDGFLDGYEIEQLYSPVGEGRLSAVYALTACLTGQSTEGVEFTSELEEAICGAASELYTAYLLKEAHDIAAARTQLVLDRVARCDALYAAGSSENFLCSAALQYLFVPLVKEDVVNES
ncbi:MAG: hypothetical protein WCV86_03610 [Patescibacteria group bacterium]|jgi:hypothetical protein